MSELDFDELDKAVNTLMGDVPNVEPSKPDDTKTLNINSTLSDTARPSLAELNSALTQVNSPAAMPVAAPVTTAPSVPTSPLAARRGGRFMDVVHPSSDMKGAVRPAGVSSRQGVTIEPSEKLLLAKSEDQTASEQPSPAALFANETHDVVPTKDISSEQQTAQNDWPDPLEMSGYGVEPDTTSVMTVSENALVGSPVDADISAGSTSPIVSATPEEEVQPLTSPFIADAKVDKRPLGGAPSEEQPGELDRAPMLGSLATNAMASTDPSDQLPANPSEVEPQLPPELQSDLMAIETDGDTSAGTETSKEAPAVTPAVEKVPVTPVVSAAAVAAPAAGPTSITQQYHEEPSTSDQTNGSIYDMASYHQPLAHPVKKKSGWLWIVWILLLLIIGGGSAAALYFFDII